MFAVYILASRPRGALYVGRSNDLTERLAHHRLGLSRHTSRYGIRTLVWFELHETFAASLQRERAIKRWRRAWKDELIEAANPGWLDISGTWAP
ncbi:GIY-YIG nuclease family protein [Jannaschia sp. LMIT008]|uniref:GIY-YIG nuclease family protein n=1 Tax=Jannaschia maritima TaxID=3032585 RepID=UPI00281255BA|nr:GIY-YIG nuclease family protein [Jannaschia sp. LMIT008]